MIQYTYASVYICMLFLHVEKRGSRKAGKKWAITYTFGAIFMLYSRVCMCLCICVCVRKRHWEDTRARVWENGRVCESERQREREQGRKSQWKRERERRRVRRRDGERERERERGGERGKNIKTEVWGKGMCVLVCVCVPRGAGCQEHDPAEFSCVRVKTHTRGFWVGKPLFYDYQTPVCVRDRHRERNRDRESQCKFVFVFVFVFV